MTADVELLPLPEVLPFSAAGARKALQDWCRANVAHATAAKDAEIEALRAERDLFRDETVTLVRQNGEWQARAERVAEALQKAEEYIDDVTPTWASKGQRVLDIIRAALHPTAAQENDDA